MYRSCTDFGGHRLLTRSHFKHSVNTLCRAFSAEHSFVMTSGWPTTHEVFMVPPLPGTAPPSAPAFPRDQGLSPAPPIRVANRQQAASAPLQRDLRRFATCVASLHTPTPAVSRRTCHLRHSPTRPSPAESSLLLRGRPSRHDGVLPLRCCPLRLDRSHIAALFREFSHRRVRPECASSSGAPGEARCADSDAPRAANLLAPYCRKHTPQQNGRSARVRLSRHVATTRLPLRHSHAARRAYAQCGHRAGAYLHPLRGRPATPPS